MSAHVLDASVIVALFVEESETPNAERALQALADEQAELHAPDLIVYEIANALWKRTARGDISPELATQRMNDFDGLEIELYRPQSIARAALGLAISQKLTAYDAAYLAVALALGAPLLTLDGGLRDRCAAAGITAPPL